MARFLCSFSWQSECAAPASRHSEEHDEGQRASDVPDISNNGASGQSENWMVLSIAGEKPAPRFNVYCLVPLPIAINDNLALFSTKKNDNLTRV